MHWHFRTEMEDLGRMEARVLEVLNRVGATVISLSSCRRDGRIFLSGVIDAEEKLALRIEALLKGMPGMCSASIGH